MTCKDCRFAVEGEISPGELKRTYNCRRYPPTIIPVMSQQGMAMLTAYPSVEATMSCGEHRVKLHIT